MDVITSASEAVRTLTLRELGKDVDRLVAVVERESGTAQRTRRSTTRSSVSDAQKQQAFVSQLQQAYDPPGELREGQARHDNDFADIAQIRIAPTHQELMSPIGPYLPVMLADAPNHLPPGSIERHIDGQFRLLREELTLVDHFNLCAVLQLTCNIGLPSATQSVFSTTTSRSCGALPHRAERARLHAWRRC